MRKYILNFIFLLLAIGTKAQLTSIFTDKELIYKQAIGHYELDNADRSSVLFARYADRYADKLFGIESRLYELISAFESDKPDAEELMGDFVKNHSTGIFLNYALLAEGNYYFRQKEYEPAIGSYEKISVDGLQYYYADEVNFKLAYSYFVRREFDKAALLFRELSLIKRKYFYPSNYYYGICMFLNSDFERAINSFNIVKSSGEYRNYVPYYLVQLYFAQGQYDNAISMGEESLKSPGIENRFHIHQLLGNAYFLKSDYENALIHLKEYEKNTERLSETDFYTLGFLYHNAGNCQEAIRCLSELTGIQNELGQNANYYIADCYMKTGNRESARTAFKNASNLNFNRSIIEESILNYGKLSAEMGYDREAINALMQIGKNSQYYLETQEILKNIFINTRDYAAAQAILEELNEVSPNLFEAYQVVSYYKGLKGIIDGQYDIALEDLRKSEKVRRDIRTSIQTQYWLGDLLHKKGDYTGSNQHLDRYFVLIQGIDGIEDLTQPPFAHYIQGYNYYKLNNYPASIRHFNSVISTFDQYRGIDTRIRTRMINDSYLRLGDAYFYNRQFNEALRSYNTAINKKADNIDYALFQKAVISGLQKKEEEKISLLTDIMLNYRRSGIRPLAMLELANTYNDLNQSAMAYELFEKITKEYQSETAISNIAYLKMGLISYNKGDIPVAIINYKAVMENNPGGTEKREALLALEEIYVNDIQNTDEFINYLQTIPDIELGDSYTDSLNFIAARIQFESGDIENAMISLNNYLDRFDKGFYALDARFYRAEAYLRNREYVKALADFEHIIDQGFSNNYESALYKAAVITFNFTKNYRKSIDFYKKLEPLIKDENMKYEVQLGIMRNAFMLNNYDDVTIYGNLIINNKLTTDREKSAAHYYIGKVAKANKRYDTALLHLNIVIRENPNSNLAAESRYLISRIYFLRNEQELAKKMISDANVKNSSYPYWVAKGLILFSEISLLQDDLFNAKAALEAVKENYTEDAAILKEVEEKLSVIRDLEAGRSRIERQDSSGNIILDDPR